MYLIALILTVATTFGAYFFGKNYEESKQKLVEVIDQKVVEYRINEDLKDKVNIYLQTAVERTVDSRETTIKIENLISQSADDHIQQSVDEIEEKLKDIIGHELEKLKGLDTQTILSKASVPSGAIMAFSKSECPSGWKIYREAHGRTIIGAGKGDGIKVKTLFEKGGEEKHTLTLSELPSHQHETIVGAQSATAKWGFGDKVNSIWAKSWGSYPNGMTSLVGEDQAHNNMPPYIALRYCVKQ